MKTEMLLSCAICRRKASVYISLHKFLCTWQWHTWLCR